MRWPWSRSRDASTGIRVDAALRELRKDDKGQMLNRCVDDDARYRMCVRWAEQSRDGYYQGLRESISDMLLSNDRRYRHMSVEVRTIIGERKWVCSLKAKGLIGLEQMYSRWASQYKAGPESRIS